MKKVQKKKALTIRLSCGEEEGCRITKLPYCKIKKAA